jgi:hypothetical protein
MQNPTKGVAGAELGNYKYLQRVKPILKICGMIWVLIYFLSENLGILYKHNARIINGQIFSLH